MTAPGAGAACGLAERFEYPRLSVNGAEEPENLQCAGGCGAVRPGVTSEFAAVPPCCRCSGKAVKKDGRRTSTYQRYWCHGCRRTFTARTGTPFARHRWPLEVITTAVRWYCWYRLSAADVRDLIAEL